MTIRLLTAIVLTLTAIAGAVCLVHSRLDRQITITAYFSTATAIYPGDDVRVSGVRVGRIDGMHPDGTRIAIVLKVDHRIPVPADAKAVIVAQNLIAARYIQLTPAYRTTGPALADGAAIPEDRTAVPVEWDEVKEQLMRLSSQLGPHSGVSTPAVARFIDSAADAMAGNGLKLRTTLAELAKVGRIMADGSGNIAQVLADLEHFVSILKNSNQQIVAFEGRLATLSSVLDDNKSTLDAALSNLSAAIADIQRFVATSRDKTSQQVQHLAAVTQTLVDHRTDIENVLHVAPNALANGYNIYNPDTGSGVGSFSLNNFSNPLQLICGAIGSLENATAEESAKLCAQQFGPALRLLNANFLPAPINPYLAKSASPDNIIYTDPALAPGGSGGRPTPPEPAPAVSAYGRDPGDPPAAGEPATHLPAFPSPALFPGAPIPAPTPTVKDLLLPAEAAPATGAGADPGDGRPQP